MPKLFYICTITSYGKQKSVTEEVWNSSVKNYTMPFPLSNWIAGQMKRAHQAFNKNVMKARIFLVVINSKAS